VPITKINLKGNDGSVFEPKPKKSASLRKVFISRETIDLLKEYVGERWEGFIFKQNENALEKRLARHFDKFGLHV
jgi:hypothetical protein